MTYGFHKTRQEVNSDLLCHLVRLTYNKLQTDERITDMLKFKYL